MAITIRKIACPEPPVGADLMKTGQTTSYRTGDDGDIEAGRDVDFFTLSANNPFGNTNRFTDELGGTAYANNIVIDWSTYNTVTGKVLGYNRVTVVNSTWALSIDNALAYSVGTFTTGWRLANANEINYIKANYLRFRFNYAPFNIALTTSLTTSTSIDATNAVRISTDSNQSINEQINKSSINRAMYVRTFTVTGTTLT